MQEEAWASIPRDKRPLPEELDGYEQEYENDPDYSMYRVERGKWIQDYNRREEEERARGASNNRTPLEGHGVDKHTVQAGRTGFDREQFEREHFSLDKVVETSKSRPLH